MMDIYNKFVSYNQKVLLLICVMSHEWASRSSAMKNLLQKSLQRFKEKLDNVIYPDNEVGVWLFAFSLIKVAIQCKVGDVAGGKRSHLEWRASRAVASLAAANRRSTSAGFGCLRLSSVPHRPRSPGLGLIHFNWSVIRFYFLSNWICSTQWKHNVFFSLFILHVIRNSCWISSQ